jgi:hypothetical protein
VTASFKTGSYEYLRVRVTANVPLDEQPVELSMDDGETWLPAVWLGSPGTTRLVRTMTPITWATGSGDIVVKVTDVPEVPLIPAGKWRAKE